ncbi:MAG: hypothetical protein E6P95_02870 [Candidatus Moraniibacteriota bacterium]|nr:MAG: hypothetical protein E6P95_02870 [Candidatus Moranbacteria bacterium]
MSHEFQEIARILVVVAGVSIALIIYAGMLRRPHAFPWDVDISLTTKPPTYHHGNVRRGCVYHIWDEAHKHIQPIVVLDKYRDELEIGVFPPGQYRSPRAIPADRITFRGWVRGGISSDTPINPENLNCQPWVSGPEWQPNSF